MLWALVAVLLVGLVGCNPAGSSHRPVLLRMSGGGVGKEQQLLERQLDRFMRENPDVEVVVEATPNVADQRHQLYVQWLSAGVGRPDVLQLDVIWTAEFAGAGWLLPLGGPETGKHEYFRGPLRAHRYQNRLYALPWFVDVGMLYYRSDELAEPPRTLAKLRELAAPRSRAGFEHGLVWQQARYEGLVTVFLEVLGAFGGSILDSERRVTVDSPEATRALEFMLEMLRSGATPEEALSWHEEQTRFAFQNGEALFMRNWPYAFKLMQADGSPVRGKFAVAPMPATEHGKPTAALGGAGLGVNAFSAHPEAARRLVRFLVAPRQMRERASELGYLPTRPESFDDPALDTAFGASPRDLRAIIEHAEPRPVHPMYTELSSILQTELHRALTGQVSAARALDQAATRMRRVLRERGPPATPVRSHPKPRAWPWLVLLAVGGSGIGWWWWRRRTSPGGHEPRIAWKMVAPAVVVLVVLALLPLALAFQQSLYTLDLRTPWRSAGPSLDNYAKVLQSPEFWGALQRTVAFMVVSVSLELGLGLALALALHRRIRFLGAARVVALIPWAIPTVVAGLLWRVLFEGRQSLVNALLVSTGASEQGIAWFSGEFSAWVPIVLSDVWKTTPFVTLLLLAGLSTIDPRLYEAARVDGAFGFQQFRHVTLPLLRPTLMVAVLFRALDALRVFDLIYVLTQGGPGTATEPLSLFNFNKLFSHLRFGEGAAVSVLIFAFAGILALSFVGSLMREEER